MSEKPRLRPSLHMMAVLEDPHALRLRADQLDTAMAGALQESRPGEIADYMRLLAQTIDRLPGKLRTWRQDY